MAITNLLHPWPSAAPRLRRAAYLTELRHDLFFEDLDHPGRGFSFPCDASGRIARTDLRPAMRERYDHCVEDEVLHYKTPVVRVVDVQVYDHGAVECMCGHPHELKGETSACTACGQLFNATGQFLLPRSKWTDL